MAFKKTFLFLCFLMTGIVQAQTLHLYGGADQDQYLGCLNCDTFDKDSVWNKFSDYGNIFSSKSIWNTNGNYGSIYSTYSPWSTYASYPPAIRDQDGNFYGFLTLNPYKSERSELELAVILCTHHEDIKADIGGWYDKLFRY
ncbi:hypothetical protein [Chryseobacterium indologenes]|uniref:hypothetical protein n=1 Tax=Chryseobacterium indologenes TaxID=253 RepID=UPI000B5177DA|nr:hypothetical protein [Chryseobacterium indologenes]ASE61981.1 hypothetical protein CEQ15_11015 [Chryseobacterium indologenes]VFA41567.1 Uncharacterised protein [Chryseobacterium indologenes]